MGYCVGCVGRGSVLDVMDRFQARVATGVKRRWRGGVIWAAVGAVGAKFHNRPIHRLYLKCMSLLVIVLKCMVSF